MGRAMECLQESRTDLSVLKSQQFHSLWIKYGFRLWKHGNARKLNPPKIKQSGWLSLKIHVSSGIKEMKNSIFSLEKTYDKQDNGLENV